MTPASPHPRRLASRHVAVTGAGTGIGRAIALRLAAEGAALTLLARDAARLEAAAADCRAVSSGAEVEAAACDVRERAQLDEALAQATAGRGPLHAFVANAGAGGPNADGADDRFDELVDTNLRGTYNCFRAAQQRLAPAGEGARHLVAVSSILARIGVPGYTGYCASKAGILGLVRSLAMELAPEEVQVNAICPGWVDTAMAREGIEGIATGMGTSFEEAHRAAMSDVPLGRMSAPEDVAGMTAWLISEDARGVTGQGLDMNGGAFM